MNRRTKGKEYEEYAALFLERKGYCILEHNYYCKVGEVDIIARDGTCIVFVEVKYRKDDCFGNGFEAVDRRKQRKISDCMLQYMTRFQLYDEAFRFDVVSILGSRISLIKDAFPFYYNGY